MRRTYGLAQCPCCKHYKEIDACAKCFYDSEYEPIDEADEEGEDNG